MPDAVEDRLKRWACNRLRDRTASVPQEDAPLGYRGKYVTVRPFKDITPADIDRVEFGEEPSYRYSEYTEEAATRDATVWLKLNTETASYACNYQYPTVIIDLVDEDFGKLITEIAGS